MEKYRLELTREEREELLLLVKTGKSAAYILTHARILLGLDEGGGRMCLSDESLAEVLHVGIATIRRVKARCVLEGVASALGRKPHIRSRSRVIEGTEEAHLIALCCSKPPEGRSRWTLKLLANRLISLEIVESVSATTVGRTLKKTS